MTQHSDLTPERWSQFTRTQQILQIGVEMQRSLGAVTINDMVALRASYERVLRLVDLTVQVNAVPHLRRELLRWRGVVAWLYVSDTSDEATHKGALRVLFELDPGASIQVQYLDA